MRTKGKLKSPSPCIHCLLSAPQAGQGSEEHGCGQLHLCCFSVVTLPLVLCCPSQTDPAGASQELQLSKCFSSTYLRLSEVESCSGTVLLQAAAPPDLCWTTGSALWAAVPAQDLLCVILCGCRNFWNAPCCPALTLVAAGLPVW